MTLTWWDKKEDARALAEQGVEVWTECPYTSQYAVSNLGRVKSAEGKLLSLTPMKAGYVSVMLRLGVNTKTSKLVHRLVVEAFDGPPPSSEHTDVRHLNARETDNRLCNLCWGTRSENMRDVFQHKRAAIKDRTKVEVDHKWKQFSWYNSNTDVLVAQAIKLYDQNKITIQDMADMVGCTWDVACNLLKGDLDIGQPKSVRGAENGRVGDIHYRSVCSDKDLATALQLYVDNHWSGVQFADYLGIKQITAHAILKGSNRTNVVRPAGFQYPWPDATTMNALKGDQHAQATLTEDEILAVFRRIENGAFKDMKEVQSALNTTRGIVYSVVAGRSWSHLHRSDKLKQQVAKMQRDVLAHETQQAIIKDLMAGMNRNDVKAKYDLSDSKIAFYVTKVNKMKTST
jgi:hypothetical protein